VEEGIIRGIWVIKFEEKTRVDEVLDKEKEGYNKEENGEGRSDLCK